MRLRSLIITTTALASAGIALPGTAAADAPTRETVHVTRNVPVFAPCSGFVVTATFDLIREVTTFTDAAGTPVRRSIHATITGVLANSVTGYALPSTGVRNFEFDLAAHQSFSTGTNTLVHPPDGPAIHLGTGRLQFDDTTGQVVGYSGPTDESDYQALCTVLS